MLAAKSYTTIINIQFATERVLFYQFAIYFYFRLLCGRNKKSNLFILS